MAWRNKNSEFIYTIRTSIERNRIEQVTTKDAYTFWLLQGGKVYRSVNWVYRYYNTFDHGASLDDKTPHYFEQIRRRGFKQEKLKEKKLVYTTYEYFTTLTTEEKEAVALVWER